MRALQYVTIFVLLALMSIAPLNDARAASMKELRRDVMQGVELLKQDDCKSALVYFVRAERVGRKLLNTGELKYIQLLLAIVECSRRIARFDMAVTFGEKAVGALTKLYGPDHKETGDALHFLARAYEGQRRYDPAIKAFRQSHEIAQKNVDPKSEQRHDNLLHMARVYRKLTQFGEAEKILKQVLADREQTLGRDHVLVAEALSNLAEHYYDLGRYADAEPLYQRSLLINEAQRGPEHADVADALSMLAAIHYSNGEYKKTEALYVRALAINRKVHGPKHRKVTGSMTDLATVYADMGANEKSLALHLEALKQKEKNLGRDHRSVGDSLNNIAVLYRKLDRQDEALKLYLRARKIAARVHGEDHQDYAMILRNMANIYTDKNDRAQAKPLLLRALEIERKTLGQYHDSVARLHRNIGILFENEEQWEKSYDHFLQASRIQEHRLLTGDVRLSETGVAASVGSEHFDAVVPAAWNLSDEKPDRLDDLIDVAFQSAQAYGRTSTGTALGKMATRLSVGDNALAKILRQQQDLVATWQEQNKLLIDMISAPASAQRTAEIARLNAQQVRAKNELNKLRSRIERDFPQFAELDRPRSLKIAEVQNFLQPDEMLLFFHARAEDSFIWGVNDTDVHWRLADLGQDAITQAVATLRKGLDPSQASSQDPCIDPRFEKPCSAHGAPFDLKTAHELHQALIEPFKTYLKGRKRLIIIANGALSSLPFHVLVTEKPKTRFSDFAGYRNTPWLARQYSVNVLPSVTSLKSLRVLADRLRAPDPYIGFGDPVFSPGQLKGEKRQVALTTMQGKQLDKGYTAFFRGARPDLELLRNALAPLPETADEVRTIARLVGAPGTAIRLGQNASERAIKTTTLERYRIIHFATHALIAGETASIGGASEPSLALTIPKTATETDDGLLVASEVAQLRLNADWVILSACNTAAGDRPGADALSGFAKAFFYSGARALLVSHWPVLSDAAVHLTTKSFELIKSTPGISRAESLRRSMVELLNNTSKPENAHPSSWAPFVIVGIGGLG